MIVITVTDMDTTIDVSCAGSVVMRRPRCWGRAPGRPLAWQVTPLAGNSPKKACAWDPCLPYPACPPFPGLLGVCRRGRVVCSQHALLQRFSVQKAPCSLGPPAQAHHAHQLGVCGLPGLVPFFLYGFLRFVSWVLLSPSHQVPHGRCWYSSCT